MSYEDILRDLKKKIYHPVYVLDGEEPYFIDKISSYIEDNVLTDAEKSFNQTVVYGKDTDPIALLDVLRRYPMMSNYQVVIMKEAQQCRGLDKLIPYFKAPLKSTIFVLCHKYKKVDKRTSLAQVLKKKAVIFTSKKLYENQVPAFVTSTVEQLDHKISRKAAILLTEYLGTDLSKIENSLKKLSLNVPKESTIDVEHIEKFIGISKDYNVFELTNALINRDSKKAFRIVDYFIKNPKPNPPLKVIGALYAFYGRALVFQSARSVPSKEVMSRLRLHPAMMRDLNTYKSNFTASDTARTIDILQEYDLKSKGVGYVGSDKGPLLTEMVYRILD